MISLCLSFIHVVHLEAAGWGETAYESSKNGKTSDSGLSEWMIVMSWRAAVADNVIDREEARITHQDLGNFVEYHVISIHKYKEVCRIVDWLIDFYLDKPIPFKSQSREMKKSSSRTWCVGLPNTSRIWFPPSHSSRFIRSRLLLLPSKSWFIYLFLSRDSSLFWKFLMRPRLIASESVNPVISMMSLLFIRRIAQSPKFYLGYLQRCFPFMDHHCCGFGHENKRDSNPFLHGIPTNVDSYLEIKI